MNLCKKSIFKKKKCAVFKSKGRKRLWPLYFKRYLDIC